MVDGKKKGSAYERKISKKLSLWYTNGKKEDTFYRTAGSGSKATVSNGINYNYYGDIGFRDSIGQPLIENFCIECKSYKDFSLLNVLKNNKELSLIEKFWSEAKKEADDSNRYPILIMKKNYFPDMIMIYEDVMDKRKLNNYIIYDNGLIMLLSDFFNRIDPQWLIER